MRPKIIMTAAIAVALCIAGAILSFNSFRLAEPPRLTPKPPAAPPPPAPLMKTTVEQPGGVASPTHRPGANGSPLWSFGCVALLTAPKTMQVDDIADVETTLLTASGRDAVGQLSEAAQKAADAIDKSSATVTTAGLDAVSADAIRRMVYENKGRQAAVDTLPGAPIMTVHLSGPGFRITPNTPERQAVTANAPAIWRWTIKAVDAGSRILTVAYNAEVTVAGQRLPESLRTISRTVAVNVRPSGALERVASETTSAKTVAENLSWFWTTLIFPAGMFLYGLHKWRRERHP